MKIKADPEVFFYKTNKDIKFILINMAVLVVITIALYFIGRGLSSVVPYSFAIILLFYSFYSMGREGGVSYAFVFGVMLAVMIFSPAVFDRTSCLIIFCISASLLAHFSGMIKWMDEAEVKNIDSESKVEGETVTANEKLAKLRGVLTARRTTLEKYRVLNKIAEQLMRTLDKKEILSIISGSISSMIGNKPVKCMLLVKDEQTDVFYPAVEEQKEEKLVKNAISIYKKDPFDEWIIKNKFTLFIKDLDDDLRFRNLRKDWIAFKSLIAMPLFENKKLIGILKFYSGEPDVFGIEDVRLLNYLGDNCATALENSMLYQKTNDLAIRDGLTGLFIRRHFIEKLDEEMRRVKHAETPAESLTFSYLMIDIDHFKNCNDTFGHQFGDKVLKTLGGFLIDDLREIDMTGRYGGEEFAVILPNTNLNGAKFVANRLRENFSKMIFQPDDKHGIKLTLSIGGIEFKKEIKLTELINKADKALYHSKENGRNMVTFWEDISDER